MGPSGDLADRTLGPLAAGLPLATPELASPLAVSPTAHQGHTHRTPPTEERMGGPVSGPGCWGPRRPGPHRATRAGQTPGTFSPRDPGRPSQLSRPPPPYTSFE